AHDRRQDAIRSTHGLSALEHLHAPGGTLWWRPSGPDAPLRGAISHHGFRATHLPGELARHRDLPFGTSLETLPMGFRNPVRRSTLADANETRDWRIYADLAQRLIAQARRLYAGDSLGLDLDNTVYALDSTTIDLCLSVFPWARFRTTKAAVKMHTLLDLRGSIPSFIHISEGKLHDVAVSRRSKVRGQNPHSITSST